MSGKSKDKSAGEAKESVKVVSNLFLKYLLFTRNNNTYRYFLCTINVFCKD
jgi:hypothetical protein